MAKHTILIVEASPSHSIAYAAQLERIGFGCLIVDTAQLALDELTNRGGLFSAILFDLEVSDGDGLSLLKANSWVATRWPVVVATADGSINRAIEAIGLGAYDFVVKPVLPSRLATIMNAAVNDRVPTQVTVPAKTGTRTDEGFMGFIGSSRPMQNLYDQIERVANSRATIFITGESGTGKEVCAEAIHKSGPRALKPFVAINCGAIPEDLLESELFGQQHGPLAAAKVERIGAVQAASGGTLFLDEICEMEPRLQLILLRFLQTGAIQGAGSSNVDDVDVRIICATNRNPETEISAGRFREDLYYRLAVVPIEIPPLRSRGDDIALLANRFLQRFACEEGKCFGRIPDDDAEILSQHVWPGNVRELQNLVRRAAVMYEGPNFPKDAFPSVVPLQPLSKREQPVESLEPTPPETRADLNSLINCLNGLTLDEIERIAIESAIDQSGGSLPIAARRLGVSPSTLYRKRERWLQQ
jgi:two-component system, repressor protein LuxO